MAAAPRRSLASIVGPLKDEAAGSAEKEVDFEVQEYDDEVDELRSMEEDQPAVEVVAATNTPVSTSQTKAARH